MTAWEFLIQREGDRGWRTIKTGNLQMTEGRYRIAATSQLLAPQMQTRITYQPLGATAPHQRSRTEIHKIDASGLAIVMPLTQIQSGIWQFVCSGMTLDHTPWHQILKLRVLPRPQTPMPARVDPMAAVATAPVTPQSSSHPVPHGETTTSVLIDRVATAAASDDLPQPTAPLVSLSTTGEQEPWADGLDRLLAQIEQDSLRTRPPSPQPAPPLKGIQITAIADFPSQLISLNRSTFSGMIPGHQLTVNGACNLPLLNIKLVQTVKIEKLSICLRHPQTAEIIASIEHPIPPDLDKFGFSGRLELPTELKVSLLLGEVNLYDRHHIQIASSGFTITVNLNPLHESELSLLQLFDRDRHHATAAIDRLTQDLDVEATTIGMGNHSPRTQNFATPSTIPPLGSPQYPTVPLAYRRESVFAHQPEIVPTIAALTSPDRAVETIVTTDPQSSSPLSTHDITGDLEIDFARPPFDRVSPRNYPNLEIVVED
jgi:hypothetical protein